MKELSIEEKAKAYNEAIKKARVYYKSTCLRNTLETLENIFPELKESEDEKIRKTLIEIFSSVGKKDWRDIPTEKIIAWLEKQGQELKKVSIWKHWKNGIAGNGEGKQIYLIKIGNTYKLSSCLSFECDYIELSELDNLMLEKKGEQNPAEWSEEDKEMIFKICQNLYDYPCVKSPFNRESFNEAEKEVQFIKSITLQKQWKPSEK